VKFIVLSPIQTINTNYAKASLVSALQINEKSHFVLQKLSQSFFHDAGCMVHGAG